MADDVASSSPPFPTLSPSSESPARELRPFSPIRDVIRPLKNSIERLQKVTLPRPAPRPEPPLATTLVPSRARSLCSSNPAPFLPGIKVQPGGSPLPFVVAQPFKPTPTYLNRSSGDCTAERKAKACYKCGDEGHLSRECPQNPAGGAGAGYGAGGFGGAAGGGQVCYKVRRVDGQLWREKAS